MSEPARPPIPTRVPMWAALIPGLPFVLRRRWMAGGVLFAVSGFLAAVLFAARDDIAATFRGGAAATAGARAGALDEWVALLTLIGGLAAALAINVAAARRGGEVEDSYSSWRETLHGLKANRLALGGALAILLLALIALLVPYIAPYDPSAIGDIVATRNLRPSFAHLMGTDRLGRDVFSRVVYGARISLTIGLLAITISVTLGTAVGAVSGYFGGIVDGFMMRLVDVMIAFPRLVLLIVIVSLFSGSVLLVVLVLGLTLWPSTARIVRGEVLSLREREFVQAARALGYSDLRIIARHITPNVLAPVIVAATLGIGNVILIEAGLTFLGLGVPIDVPTWGRILQEGRGSMISAWWVATFPGLAIVYTVVAFNLIGDGLRDALDPRLRE